MRVRFTKEKHRFVIGPDNSVRVYARYDDPSVSTEHVVSPQKRTSMIGKYRDHIDFVIGNIPEDIECEV